jgi:hypothetical protein
MEHLLAAAHILTGVDPADQAWEAFSGAPVPTASPAYALAAQRAVRCLAIMQHLMEECQVMQSLSWPAAVAITITPVFMAG